MNTTPGRSARNQKLRTFPIVGRGAGTLVQSINKHQVEEVSLSFLKAINYRGPAAVCFKQDAQTKHFVAIEVNARLSLHHSLAAHCGIDFSYLLYLDSLGELDAAVKPEYPGNVKWIAALYDTASFLQHRKADGLSIGNWLQSYRGPRTYGDWCWNDPWPFIKECVALIPTVARKFRFQREA